GPVSRPLPADVHRFRAVVARRLGLQFEDGRLDLLADLLQQRCERWGGGSCTEYLDRLASDAGSPQELPALATELTVGQPRYFRPNGRGFVLDDAIRRSVVFEERNLLDDDPAFWQPETFDVIFCRNVIMYFTPETIRLVIARIARALAPGGFLFLGYAETLR